MAGTKTFPHQAYVAFYVSLALLMIFGRGLGELSRMLRQPAILGEILAGVFLGKTIFGRIWPEGWAFVFGPGPQSVARTGVSSLASTFFMLVAGLEMDLDQVLARKKKAAVVGFCSVLVPFVLGFGVTYADPTLMGSTGQIPKDLYALFAGAAMAITAMPVVAKTLRDVGLLRSELGRVVMASATIDDLCGWSLFAIVLSLANPGGDASIPGLGVGGTIAISILFVFFVVIFGRLAFGRFFLWINSKFSFPGGIMGFVISWMLSCAAFGYYIGLHNTLAAFLVGASLSNNRHLRSRVKEVIDIFVTYCFAPIFFANIAISADFISNFDIALISMVLFIACVGKMIGATFGAKISGSEMKEALSVATCMNSRGAMEILLATVALESGIIDERMFVALVFMAIVTSLVPGPVLRKLLKRKERKAFTTYIPNPNGFIKELTAVDAASAIREMCLSINKEGFIENVLEKQNTYPCGNQDQLALIHIPANVKRPKIVIGLSKEGIDFSGELGQLENPSSTSNIIVIVFVPENLKDQTLLDDLIQQISMVFARYTFRKEFLKSTKLLEVLSLVNFEIQRLGLHSTTEEMDTEHGVVPQSFVKQQDKATQDPAAVPLPQRTNTPDSDEPNNQMSNV